ncbi:hypothetical protein BKA66DRAFT_574897 [Pyrenochaeta sp. MPI-SDFR-AT-0127]|nr:hypothetical protein BKA66DRAFT_574897 [Pyrenochaeta sp. MPI-SDFR-AT-0127]
MATPQSEWSHEHQRWLYRSWDSEKQRYYWLHFIADKGWVFFDWCPQAGPSKPYPNYPLPQREHSTLDSKPYEVLDPAFHVRDGSYFEVGRVFAVLFTESAGDTVTDYNDALSIVRFSEVVHSQIRRFVVVSHKKSFCFAIPIFTYGNQGTKKPGVNPEEHAIAYSHGSTPKLLVGEHGISKNPICVVTNPGEPHMSMSARIFFGLHHPIQYNVKVKDLGYVHPDYVPKLIGYWHEETNGGGGGSVGPIVGSDRIAAKPEVPREEDSMSLHGASFDLVMNPRAYFKKGRVFITPWIRLQNTPEIAWFAVVKPKGTYSICLRISVVDDQTALSSTATSPEYGIIIPHEEIEIDTKHGVGDQSSERTIHIKVENDSIMIKPESRINFAKPYTVEHDVKVRNVGRVYGDSLGRMEEYFAESLGLVKPT